MIASLRRMTAIAMKEFMHIRRDRRTLLAVLVLPAVELVLFAYAISFDVRNVPTIVLDQDRTPASRDVVGAFEHSDFFEVIGHASSYADIDDALDASRARAAVIVPPGFSRSLDRGEEAALSVLIDGSEPNSAQIGDAYARGLTQTLDRRIRVDYLERRGVDIGRAGMLGSAVRTWYNPERRSADFLIPGLLVVIIMIVTIQQTAVTLVREREQGTFEQLLVSPLRRVELMIGKCAPWVLFGILDTAGIVLLAVFAFGVPLRGSAPVFGISAVLFVLCSLAIGLIISARATSVEAASLIGYMISFLPSFMLSGFAFPLDSLPVFLQWVSYAFPGRYMVIVARSVFLKGTGIVELWPQVVSLAIYAVVSLTIATLLYSRRSR